MLIMQTVCVEQDLHQYSTAATEFHKDDNYDAQGYMLPANY